MSAGAGKKGGAGAGADAVTGSRTGLPQPSKHATDFEVRVVARVRGHPPMTLRASRYGATGNYQLQNVAENRPYFDLINSLGANTKYITLKNDLWIQCVCCSGDACGASARRRNGHITRPSHLPPVSSTGKSVTGRRTSWTRMRHFAPRLRSLRSPQRRESATRP